MGGRLRKLREKRDRIDREIKAEKDKTSCLICGDMGVLRGLETGFVTCFGCYPDQFGELQRARVGDIEWAWSRGGVAQLVDNPVPRQGFGSRCLVRAWLRESREFPLLIDALKRRDGDVIREFMERVDAE